jgi:hypothetical protein
VLDGGVGELGTYMGLTGDAGRRDQPENVRSGWVQRTRCGMRTCVVAGRRFQSFGEVMIERTASNYFFELFF